MAGEQVEAGDSALALAPHVLGPVMEFQKQIGEGMSHHVWLTVFRALAVIKSLEEIPLVVAENHLTSQCVLRLQRPMPADSILWV